MSDVRSARSSEVRKCISSIESMPKLWRASKAGDVSPKPSKTASASTIALQTAKVRVGVQRYIRRTGDLGRRRVLHGNILISGRRVAG
jgi:hypothetical protein